MQFSFQMPWARQNAPPNIAGHKVELPKADLKGAATDAKRVVSDSADQIASVAADVSRDAGKVAADLSREAVKIGREAAKIGRQAGKKAGELAVSGQASLRTLGADAQATVEDLRSYKVVKKSGPDLRPGLALFAGISAGVAAMFFLDPEHGRRRRVLLMDQLRKWFRLSGEWLDGAARDLRNRSVGLAHETRKAVAGATEAIAGASERATDDVIETTPDAAGDLEATDQAVTSEYPEPSYVGDRTH